jgi:putrescine transport system ATP-binding protein
MAALEALDIAELAGRKPHQLSGGQSQRVALARALVKRPEVLLLDEPFSALDPQTRDRARAELRALLSGYETTVLMVTHDQEEAMAMSSQVALIRDGSLVQVGTPVDLYRRPASAYAAEFFGTANLFRGTIVAHSADRTAIRHEGSGATLFAEPTPPLPIGAAAILIVRPEAVRLAPDGPEAIKGRLESRMFLGREWELVVAVELGQRVVVRIPASASEPDLPLNRDVFLGWEPKDALLLKASDD